MTGQNRSSTSRTLGRQRPRVVIAGAGLVGAATALVLTEFDFDIYLCDPQLGKQTSPRDDMLSPATEVGQFDLRVSALTRASQELLAGVIDWNLLASVIQPYVNMQVWDSQGNGRVEFAASDVYQESLGLIVENSAVVALLQEACAKAERIHCYPAGFRLGQTRSDGIVGEVDGQEITADLLIGADGANSAVRRQSGIPSREWDYGQTAIVATLRMEMPHQQAARQRFLPTGPLALLPLRDGSQSGHYCSLVWSADQARAEELMAMSDRLFAEELALHSDYVLGAVKEASVRRSFPLRQRHAKRYYADRTVLVGDAAHTIHPLAGQGVNLGFKDVMTLREEIARASARGLPPGAPEVLRRYSRRCQGPNLGMMLAMEAFKTSFGAKNSLITQLRNAALNTANSVGPLKKKIIREAMGV